MKTQLAILVALLSILPVAAGAEALDRTPHYFGPPRAGPRAGCLDETMVVGRSRCARFGDTWAPLVRLPRLQLRAGLSVRRFELRAPRTALYRLAQPISDSVDMTAASATTLDLRLTATNGPLHLGLEGIAGGVSIDEPIDSGPRELFAAGGVLGVTAAPAFFLIRAEMFSGRRWVQGSEETTAHAVLEPRVSLEALLTPWVTIGAYVGTNLLRERDMSGGIFLEGHMRAYDGRRDPSR